MFNLVSVDGFFAGVDGSIDWHVVDDEFNQYALEVIKDLDTILFGRVTYQIFEDFWPKALSDPKLSKEDQRIAQFIDSANKIVFSTTLGKVTWKNTTLLHVIDAGTIEKLKQETGKDLVIYGSGTLVRQLANLGLIDEYRVIVNPVILGKGKPLFEDIHKKNLTLLKTKKFNSGNILLCYEPAQ